MPTYEYECLKCKKTFDFVQSIKAKPLTSCPKDSCRMKTWGKGKVKRLLGGGAGIIFKGSGFYITDYRSDSYKKAAKADSSSSSSASTATPAPKADTTPKAGAKPKSDK